MSLLYKSEILRRISRAGRQSISILPLLDPAQVGEVSIDVRLGYDFRVSILTRNPVVHTRTKTGAPISAYFQSTRRDLGDEFIIYPGQLVVTTTLEYVCVPDDAMADVFLRSSYSRLGISASTPVQPGFRGCVPLEISNHSNNPVELIVGARLFQIRFMLIEGASANYLHGERKYYGAVRPVLSKADADKDMKILAQIKRAK